MWELNCQLITDIQYVKWIFLCLWWTESAQQSLDQRFLNSEPDVQGLHSFSFFIYYYIIHISPYYKNEIL